jgi:hypothetical protein
MSGASPASRGVVRPRADDDGVPAHLLCSVCMDATCGRVEQCANGHILCAEADFGLTSASCLATMREHAYGQGTTPTCPECRCPLPEELQRASRRSRALRRCPRCAGTAPRAARAGRCWGMRHSARGRQRGARPAQTDAAGRGPRANAMRTRRRACGVGQQRITSTKQIEPALRRHAPTAKAILPETKGTLSFINNMLTPCQPANLVATLPPVAMKVQVAVQVVLQVVPLREQLAAAEAKSLEAEKKNLAAESKNLLLHKNMLVAAATSGDAWMVQALLKHTSLPVDYAANSDTGATPLYYASQNGHVDVVTLLLDQGADVNKARTNGGGPLYAASQKGHVGVVEALLRKGAEVDEIHANGETSLYVAALNGNLDVVKVLLGKGASPNMRCTRQGSVEAPLAAASRKCHPAIVEVLTQYGAGD